MPHSKFPPRTNERSSYELKFDERPEYLYAQVISDNGSSDVTRAYLNDVAQKCKESKCERVLIDREIPDMPPDGAIYPVALEAHKGFDGKKVAIVEPPRTYGSMNFFKIAYESLGGECRVFETVSDAEDWLLDRGD